MIKKIRHNKLVKLAGALVIVLSVLSTGCKISGKKHKEKGKDKKTAQSVPVKIETLKKGKISSFILSSSTIKAEYSVDVVVETQGKVEKINFDEGDSVKKGDILAVVNYQELKLDMEKRKMSFLDAKKKFERIANLYKKKLVSKEDYDNAEFQYKQSKIDYENSRIKFEKSMIKAPFDGVITERYITLGQYVSPSQKAFSIVNTKILKAIVYIPEESVAKVKKGQKVILTSDTTGQTFSGKVEKISTVVDPASGTVKITVKVNPDKGIRPGMFVNVKIITDTKDNVLLIPKKAVIYQNDAKYVFLVKDGKAKKIELKTGYENKDYFECLNDNIKEGDRVIIAGQNSLKNGDKVRIINGK